jgi:aspartate kinase
MPIIVQKYGGTSVDGVERLRVVADGVVRARDSGNDVIVGV